MEILVLNGSPRPNGNTAAMVEAFAEGARGKGTCGPYRSGLSNAHRRLCGL